ncbi:unnamed protein product [Onchocerca flexuosa]|uniref:Secreted protein n=1 Tax=Onchocerca flexuosa TaxID=387005 RepID=A0A183HKH4_9BILA|nr:unnamed protein product [Onchocerca flexuosa]
MFRTLILISLKIRRTCCIDLKRVGFRLIPEVMVIDAFRLVICLTTSSLHANMHSLHSSTDDTICLGHSRTPILRLCVVWLKSPKLTYNVEAFCIKLKELAFLAIIAVGFVEKKDKFVRITMSDNNRRQKELQKQQQQKMVVQEEVVTDELVDSTQVVLNIISSFFR